MDTRVYIFSKNLFVIFIIITSLLGCAGNAKQFKIVEVILIQDRDAKRLKGQVLFVAILILIGHFIDVFIMVMPGTVGTHWHFGFVEIGTFLGYLGFFTFIVLKSLSSVPLDQKNHPMLIESKHHHI